MQSNRIREIIVMIPLLLSLSGTAIAASAEDCGIPDLRQQYAAASLAIVDATYKKNRPANNPEKIDLEKQGCISGYGLKGGFGLPSLAGGLLDGLKDKVCKAADDYLKSNLDQFSLSLKSPLNIADVDLGVERQDPEGCKDENGKKVECSWIDMKERDNELGVDFGDMIDDQFKKMPKVDSGFGDFDYDDGTDVKDYDYTTKKKKKTKSSSEGGSRR